MLSVETLSSDARLSLMLVWLWPDIRFSRSSGNDSATVKKNRFQNHRNELSTVLAKMACNDIIEP